MSPTTIQILAAACFALAIVHTFAAKRIDHLSKKATTHAGLLHLLGEVEAVFGMWALVLIVGMLALRGNAEALAYLEGRNYTEPLFVFAVMVVAATRPILQTATRVVDLLVKLMPVNPMVGYYVVLMGLVPLLGSFITEPAAMTLAAMMAADKFFARDVPEKFKYTTLGLLFVNVSIGGTLTHFAAPPVLMVAGPWGWDTSFMLHNFGWKAVVAVAVNTALFTVYNRAVLVGLDSDDRRAAQAGSASARAALPGWLVALHLLFLVLVVVYAHHPVVFMSLLVFFLGLTYAYKEHQDRLILKEALLVGFFLGGLVVLGGLQDWWLQPLLLSMDKSAVFFGAAALTAFTDNAALTYLGAQVQGLSDGFKYALVAGAVAGGGLTIIANAPNPAGVAILGRYFDDQAVKPLSLLAGAALPTAVALAAFWLL